MKDIQQLIKKNSQQGRYEDIFPKTFIDAVLDKESGVTLTDILAMFNMLFLSYNGSRSQTRLQVPSSLRREGLWITYVLYDKTVVTEWYSAEAIDDTTFGDSANWRDGSNALVGDISISSDGYWVINGEVTNIKAQGEAGITPILRVGSNNHLQVSYTNGSSYVDVSSNPVFTQFRVSNNKLQQSTDLGESWSNISEELAYKFRESGNKIQMSKDLGNTWEDVSDYIAAWFRFTGTTGSSQADNVGKIQISRDNGVIWSDLSSEFTNSLHIKGYVATIATLPSSAVQGDIYGVGPTYDPSDTEQTNPIYQLYVKDSTGWINNGRFTSISAGVVQEIGSSETSVMSQNAVCNSTGLSEYPLFSKSTGYSIGDIVVKEGKLYEFTLNHFPGEWNNTEVEDISLKSDIDNRLDEIKKGTIRLYNGTISSSTGEYIPNETTRVITDYLIPPVIVNLNSGYVIRQAAIYDRATGNFIKLDDVENTYYIDGVYIRLIIAKTDISSEITKGEDIIESIYSQNTINTASISSLYNVMNIFGRTGDLEAGYWSKQYAINKVYEIISPNLKVKDVPMGTIIVYNKSYSEIEYIQYGGGTFTIASNWTKIDINPYSVVHIIHPTLEGGFISPTNGYDTNGYIKSCVRTKYYIEASQVHQVSISINDGYAIYFRQYDKDKNLLLPLQPFSNSVVLDANCRFFRFTIERKGNSDGSLIVESELGLSVRLYGTKDFTLIEDKNPYKEGLIQLSTRVQIPMKPNDVVDTNIEEPIKYSSDIQTIGNIILKLPKSYKENGNKTRLIIFAHSSVNPEVQNFYDYDQYVDYLVGQGYAVCDCTAYATKDDTAGKFRSNVIGTLHFLCTPLNYKCYVTMYHWLMEKYNFYDEIFIFGKSHGGLQVYSIPEYTNIPVLAACSLAGAYDIFTLKFGYTNQDRIAFMDAFGFSGMEKNESGELIGEGKIMLIPQEGSDTGWSEERKQYVSKNIDKTLGYICTSKLVTNISNSEIFNLLAVDSNFTTRLESWTQRNPIKLVNTPFAIFCAEDDYGLFYENMLAKVAINNANSICFLRKMPSGSGDPHHTVDTAGPFIDSITAQDGNVYNNIPVAWAEMLNFFKQYE